LTIFYLVRHAHAEWIPDKNRPLSAKGNQDAQRVADVLQTYPVNAIYSSPARRAYQTISPLTERTGIEIKIEADLQERKLGSKVFEDFLGTVERTWHDPKFSYPVGEANNDAQKRGFAIVQQLLNQYPADHIVLSTHGNLFCRHLIHQLTSCFGNHCPCRIFMHFSLIKMVQ